MVLEHDIVIGFPDSLEEAILVLFIIKKIFKMVKEKIEKEVNNF